LQPSTKKESLQGEQQRKAKIIYSVFSGKTFSCLVKISSEFTELAFGEGRRSKKTSQCQNAEREKFYVLNNYNKNKRRRQQQHFEGLR